MICSPITTARGATTDLEKPIPFVSASPASLGRRKKVLVADDNLVFLKALTMKLRSSGFEVLMTQDGAGAVSLARREKPDLIVLDIHFPPDVAHGGGVSWDGLLIMDWLRRMEETKDTPVIIITGEDPARYEQPSLRAGAKAFFHKPIRPDNVLAVIKQTLGEASGDVPAVT